MSPSGSTTTTEPAAWPFAVTPSFNWQCGTAHSCENEPPKWAKSGIRQAAQVLGSNSPDDPTAHFPGYVAAAARPPATYGFYSGNARGELIFVRSDHQNGLPEIRANPLRTGLEPLNRLNSPFWRQRRCGRLPLFATMIDVTEAGSLGESGARSTLVVAAGVQVVVLVGAATLGVFKPGGSRLARRPAGDSARETSLFT
jgi:hypothetical protein